MAGCAQTRRQPRALRTAAKAAGTLSVPGTNGVHAADSSILDALGDIGTYFIALVYFLRGGSYATCPYFASNIRARIHIYTIYLVFYLWDRPHYRNGTFASDLRKNLRNTAIPGTGVPLSWFCHNRVAALLFFFFIYPFATCVAAIHRRVKYGHSVLFAIREQLLTPSDWFSYWRTNCALASLHAFKTGDKGYLCEDKWTFLKSGLEQQVPISPWIENDSVIVKHRNEEGGLAIHAYSNAARGGDWIIQEKLYNNAEIQALLPVDAPLSTLRIVTASYGNLTGLKKSDNAVTAMCCVFRAGRSGASTDHSSILFDVDLHTGEIHKGTTNEHWYQLGWKALRTCPWTSEAKFVSHPDSGNPITGLTISKIQEAAQLCVDAHKKLAFGVPLVGWDVALTTKGVFLLEGNFSCNFFQGHFNLTNYINLVHNYFSMLDGLVREPQ